VTAVAKDFGIEGAQFPIREESASVTIQNKLAEAKASGLIDKKNQEFAAAVKKRAARPKPVERMAHAQVYRTFLVDMSKPNPKDTLDKDGNVKVPKGTLINPLAQPGFHVTKHIVVIDGDRQEEVEYAVAYAKEHRSKIVLVKGAPFQLRGELKNNDIFFDQSGVIVRNFQLTVTPSVIYQDGLSMRVEEIPL
jgi:type-F conjugative transfer system protein TraW